MGVRRQTFAGAAALILAALLQGLSPIAQSQTPAPYTVLTREGRTPLPVRTFSGQEMVSLDDLAKHFELTVREDTLAGGLTVALKTQTIALTPGQGLASVGGRVISLPAPPIREGQTWYVPIDFLSRALGPAAGTRVEVRRPARLVLVGDVRVPRVTARFEPQDSSVRVVLDVSPATPHTVAQEPGRVLVRFEADALDVAAAGSPMPELVAGVRGADTTVAIDLGPRFSSFKTADAAGERGSGRVLIDVVAATTEAPAPPAAAPGTPTAPPVDTPLPDLRPSGGLRTIVLDPGHGGDEAGARGAGGTLEKDVTLAVARRLKGAIENRMGARVILTRDGDRTVGLDERAAVANNNKADLFLSLHANASVRSTVAGAEVFYLSLADYGDRAQQVSQGGASLPVFSGGTRDIEVILWDMAQARHIERSTIFARTVEAALRERVPMSPRSIQPAPFRVLVGANMPAVLVEIGFITNPEQEKQLASDAFQATVVQALLESIVRFRDGIVPPPAAPAEATPEGEERN